MSSVETPGYRGLSPLARGTRRINSQVQRPARFIPAGAGNTSKWRSTARQSAVYPRWRGEHLPAIYLPVAAFGLSPLARGTRRINSQVQRPARFIPAGAGNTTQDGYNRRSTAVYPRWRGEHRSEGDRVARGPGLSPLARGTRKDDPPFEFRFRFIPAGAGNTSWAETRTTRLTVYPRWRGEHTYYLEQNQQGHGLSPLARGTRLQ